MENINKRLKNCQECHACYAPYKVGPKEDGAYWCQLSSTGGDGKGGIILGLPNIETSGLCSFCNPKSVYYNKKQIKPHEKVSLYIYGKRQEDPCRGNETVPLR